MRRKEPYTQRRYDRDLKLVRTIFNEGIDPDMVFEDLEEKERLLREYGYKSLRGVNNLGEASNAQLGRVFSRVYDSAVRNIEIYQENLKKKSEERERKKTLEDSLSQPDLFSLTGDFSGPYLHPDAN